MRAQRVRIVTRGEAAAEDLIKLLFYLAKLAVMLPILVLLWLHNGAWWAVDRWRAHRARQMQL